MTVNDWVTLIQIVNALVLIGISYQQRQREKRQNARAEHDAEIVKNMAKTINYLDGELKSCMNGWQASKEAELAAKMEASRHRHNAEVLEAELKKLTGATEIIGTPPVTLKKY